MTTNAPPPGPSRDRFGAQNRSSATTQSLIPRRFRPLVLFILLTGILSIIFPDFFRAIIFDPVSSLVQIIYLIYRGIPQNLVWALFVIVAFFVAIPAIIPNIPDKPPDADPPFNDSRLANLAKLEADAHTSQHARWELARTIRQVAIALLETESSTTAESIQQRLATGEIDLPPVIEELFTVCASLPTYRTFIEAREAAPNGKIPQLAALDLDTAVSTLYEWRRSERSQP